MNIKIRNFGLGAALAACALTASAPAMARNGYGDDTAIFDPLGARRTEVLRLVGWRRPALA